jgi:hypothetical protein
VGVAVASAKDGSLGQSGSQISAYVLWYPSISRRRIMNINLQRYWWIVPIIAAVAGIAIVELTDEFAPGLTDYADILFLLLVGLSFLWAFLARGIWWAIAPAVGVLAFAVTVTLGVLFFPEAENLAWLAFLCLGAAGFVLGVIPSSRAGMKISYGFGAFILAIGFLIAPLPIVWRVILCVGSVLVGGYLVWRYRANFQAASEA